jgi:hypothetical protein
VDINEMNFIESLKKNHQVEIEPLSGIYIISLYLGQTNWIFCLTRVFIEERKGGGGQK